MHPVYTPLTKHDFMVIILQKIKEKIQKIITKNNYNEGLIISISFAMKCANITICSGKTGYLRIDYTKDRISNNKPKCEMSSTCCWCV